MSADVVAILVTLFLFGVTHTVLLVRWGTRLQTLMEQHENYLFGRDGIRTWKHDEVTPRLFQVDQMWERHKQREE